MDDYQKAQEILAAVDRGELDNASAVQLAQEYGIDFSGGATEPAVEQAPPASLVPEMAPPASLVPQQDAVQIPQIDPMLANAANNADAQQNAQMAAWGAPVGVGVAGVPGQEQVSMPAEEPVIEEVAAPVPVAPTPEPSIEQQQAAQAKINQPVQEAIAEHRATVQAQKDLQSEFAKRQAELEQQKEQLQRDIAQQDDSVRQKSLPEIMQRGSFGEKLGASIALLLGGLSQGMTGAKSNPVMDFIDRQVEAQAQRDKLNQESKLALKKSLLDIAQLQMTNQANKSQDLYHKQSLQNEAAKLQVMREQVEGDQRLKAEELQLKRRGAEAAKLAESGAVITDLSGLTDEQRKRVVRLPDGTHKLATVGADQVDAFAKMRGTLETGISGADRVKALAADFNRVTDLKKRAQIKSEIIALTGAMREPFVGPGAMTPKEYDRLIDAVGDPTSLVAIPSFQLARLLQVQTKLKSDLNSGFKRIGIDVPKTRREELIEKYSK